MEKKVENAMETRDICVYIYMGFMVVSNTVGCQCKPQNTTFLSIKRLIVFGNLIVGFWVVP